MAENRNTEYEIQEENTEMMPNNPKPDTFYAETDSQPGSAPKRDVHMLAGPRQRLHRAAMEGKWETAQDIFEKHGIEKTEKISPLGLTALHVAACCGRSEFVKKLVGDLNSKDLEASDQIGRTALHYVAIAASVSAAKALVEKNKDLPLLRDIYSDAPILYAARWRHRSKTRKMLEYLYQVTEEDEDEPIYRGPSGANLVVAITASGCYDVALRILEKHPDLASAQIENGMTILHVLAMRPSAFREGHELSLWESFVYKLVGKEETIDGSDDAKSNMIEHRQASAFVLKLCPFRKGINKVLEIKQTHADSLKLVKFVCRELQKKEDSDVFRYFFHKYNGNAVLHLAAETGVTKLVDVCLNYFPDLIWYTSNNRLLLHVAIEHRRAEIFNHLIDLIGENTKTYADLKDENGNNILHLAAQFAEPENQLMIHSVPGPAFQMRRELQWFKAVEALVYEELTMEKNKEKAIRKKKGKMKNKKGQKPRTLFVKEHETLLNEAKQWMKDTSNSCMLVATLVATVAFAAMITVPGGNESETGLPVLLKRKLFVAFSISNALSMLSSAVTLLMFLSVQTSRYTEKDFLETFPNILLIGLIFLFIAVATMMIAFGTAIGIIIQTRLHRASIPIAVVACVPALIFMKLQLPLLCHTIFFTSGPGTVREQRDRNRRCLNKIGYICPLSKDMA